MAEWRKTLTKLTCCGLCCIGASVLHAAQPVPDAPAARSGFLGRASGMLAAKPLRSQAGHFEFSRLDLRAPQTSSVSMHDQMSVASAFPSPKRSITLAGDHSLNDDLPALGNSSVRVMSKPEEIARRVQREGLPVARLWENHAALLSLGLSPKGKPGLWLIQKVP